MISTIIYIIFTKGIHLSISTIFYFIWSISNFLFWYIYGEIIYRFDLFSISFDVSLYFFSYKKMVFSIIDDNILIDFFLIHTDLVNNQDKIEKYQ